MPALILPKEPENYTDLKGYIASLADDGYLTESVRASAQKAVNIRENYEKVFYLAGALTGVSKQTKRRYDIVSELIARYARPGARMFGYAPHLHGTDPFKNSDITPAEIRDIDYMYATKVADYHINFLHPISHGNAIEEGWAEEVGIPALYVVPNGLKLSRLVLGMRNVIKVIVYDNFYIDGLAAITNFLDEIDKSN